MLTADGWRVVAGVIGYLARWDGPVGVGQLRRALGRDRKLSAAAVVGALDWLESRRLVLIPFGTGGPRLTADGKALAAWLATGGKGGEAVLTTESIVVVRCDRRGCKETRSNADVLHVKDMRTPDGFACVLMSFGWKRDREDLAGAKWRCPGCPPFRRADGDQAEGAGEVTT